MSTRTLARNLTAASLSLLLVSCSVTQPIVAAQGPTGLHDMARSSEVPAPTIAEAGR
jgi:hypothetical protein